MDYANISYITANKKDANKKGNRIIMLNLIFRNYFCTFLYDKKLIKVIFS